MLAVTVVAFFIYVAAEAGPIAWGYTYLLLDRRLAHLVAAGAIAAFWAALTAGRFGLAVLGERAPGTSVLEMSCLLVVAGIALFWLLPGALAIAGLPVAGFGFAAVFPNARGAHPCSDRHRSNRSGGWGFHRRRRSRGPRRRRYPRAGGGSLRRRRARALLVRLGGVLYVVNRTLSLVTRKVSSW